VDDEYAGVFCYTIEGFLTLARTLRPWLRGCALVLQTALGFDLSVYIALLFGVTKLPFPSVRRMQAHFRAGTEISYQ
jgi:hypothetical protein